MSGHETSRRRHGAPSTAGLGHRLALTVPFLLLLAVNSLHHEMWGDELHHWGLVLASADLGALFRNLHYEPHPGLWHLLLWVPSRLTADPAAPQLVAFAIGSAILLLIGLAAPFRPEEKLLLFLNYFILFEYTVQARNYGIGLLLALIYAAMRRRSPDSPIRTGLVLGAMANSNIYALFLSAFLAMEYVWADLTGRVPRVGADADDPLGRPGRRFDPADAVRLLPGAALYMACLAAAVWTFWPPPDIGAIVAPPAGDGVTFLARFGFAVLRTLAAPFLPFDIGFPGSFAFPGNWHPGSKSAVLALCLLPFILTAQWTAVRHRKSMLFVLAGTASVAALFQALTSPAAIRHLGVMFAAFAAVWWMVRDRMPARNWPLLGLLVMGAAGGMTALAGQWMRPFAANGPAARWAREQGLADTALIGDSDIRVEPVAILLNRPFFSLDCLCEDRYVRFTRRRDGYDPSMAPDRLAILAARLRPRPMILFAEARYDKATLAAFAAKGIRLTERAFFSGAERDKEIAIYRVDAAAP